MSSHIMGGHKSELTDRLRANSGARLPLLESWLHHLCPWGAHYTPLCLSFLLCKIVVAEDCVKMHESLDMALLEFCLAQSMCPVNGNCSYEGYCHGRGKWQEQDVPP